MKGGMICVIYNYLSCNNDAYAYPPEEHPVPPVVAAQSLLVLCGTRSQSPSWAYQSQELSGEVLGFEWVM